MNYGTIKINGTKVIGVFKIAGHDWALYMPPCKKDKNEVRECFLNATRP